MTPAEKCKKKQKKENYQSMKQERFSSSTSTSNNNSATDKMQQRTYARRESARVRKKSARECARFPRVQLVCITQPHCSRARPPLSMYATRMSEPAGAINEEEIRAHFFIGIQSPNKTTKGLSQCVALPFTLKSILRPPKKKKIKKIMEIQTFHHAKI
jgi:hypothetical protein